MFTPLAAFSARVATHPNAPALITTTSTRTVAELSNDVDAAVLALRAAGVGPRQLVAIDTTPEQEVILMLALLRLAAPSVSLRGVAGGVDLAVDAVLRGPGGLSVISARGVEIDDDWWARARETRARSGPAPTVLFARPDATARVILTSGTTGAPRAAALSLAAIEHRVQTLAHYWTDERRELNTMPLSTTGGLHTALACLVHGQPYLAIDRLDGAAIEHARAHEIEVLCGSPQQVGMVLRLIAEHAVSIPSLREVRMAGAAPSPALLRRIDEVLGVAVRLVYGSTEAGGVATRMISPEDDPHDVGAPVPGVEVSVVDESGHPVAMGESGVIRTRGAGLASGYLSTTGLLGFAGGWFLPGDRGRLTDAGHLVLDGRDDDLINVGGVKVNPATIDAVASDWPGVTDAAAFRVERWAGIIEVGLAVVCEASADLRALDAHLRSVMPVGHPTAYVRVATVPRNRMGKAQRALLAADLAPQLAAAPPGR